MLFSQGISWPPAELPGANPSLGWGRLMKRLTNGYVLDATVERYRIRYPYRYRVRYRIRWPEHFDSDTDPDSNSDLTGYQRPNLFPAPNLSFRTEQSGDPESMPACAMAHEFFWICCGDIFLEFSD